MIDILITNGQVVDGTGAPPIYASVAVKGDKLWVLREDTSRLKARRVIDANSKIVCPGFIDIHAHSSLMILDKPEHMPKVHQGVTTEVIGIDGVSYAPFRKEDDLRRMIWIHSGFDGSPELPKIWDSVGDYLEMLDRKVAINMATMVGNSPLRVGAKGWRIGVSSRKEMDVQTSLLKEAMDDGAFGLSTGLDYPPGSYAQTDELVELAEGAGKLGGFYHTHVRYSLGDQYLDPFKEALEIGRRSGSPVHLTHLSGIAESHRGSGRIIELVESARASGMDVTFDMFPYRYGGTKVLILFPQWIQDGGPENIIRVLNSDDARERLRKEVLPPFSGNWSDCWVTNFKQPHNKQYDGKPIAHVAEMRKQHPVDAMCDLLLDENLGVSIVIAVTDMSTLPDVMEHPLYMVGSDSVMIGDFPAPMAWGCYPQFLSHMVREEKRLTLQEAIRKMTSYPAARLGISDRGMLKDGLKADITVFDPVTIKPNASKVSPRQLSTGVEYVIVNGTIVIDQGKHTNELPGRSLRRGERS